MLHGAADIPIRDGAKLLLLEAPAPTGESAELSRSRAGFAAQITAVGAEGQGPVQRYPQQLQLGPSFHGPTGYLDAAPGGVVMVLGENQEFSLVAGHFHLVVAGPADERVRGQLRSFPRDGDGVP